MPSERTRRTRPVRSRPGWRQDGRAPTGAELRENVRERLIESRLTPNTISVTGLTLNVAAAVLVTQRLFFLAGVAFIVGSVMDTLDGRYSRMSGKGTLFGAFLDSTLDRIEEGIVLAAIGAYFAARGDELAVAAVVVAVLGSLMVSYTRARAEALGVSLAIGLMQRSERIVLVGLGLLVAGGVGDVSPKAASAVLTGVLLFVGALSSVTAIRRLMIGMAALAGPEPVASRAKPVASPRELDGSRP
jgi:CDP-diacylglycerol--glycerol-3-phosphate 3-phosphatidyltransferase